MRGGYTLIKELISILNVKREILILFSINAIAICLDSLVLSMIYPMLSVITSGTLPNALGGLVSSELIEDTQFISIVIITVIITAFVKMVSTYTTNKRTALLGASISNEIYNKYVLDYEFGSKINTADITSAVTIKTTEFISGTCQAIVNGLTAGLALALYVCVIVLQLQDQLVVAVFAIGVIFLIFVYITKSVMIEISTLISNGSTRIVENINETKRAIREIRSLGLTEKMIDRFTATNIKFRKAQADAVTLSQLPKIIIEPLLLTTIVLMFVFAGGTKGDGAVAVQLAALSYALTKMVPYCQQMYSSLTNLRSARSSVGDLIDLFHTQTHERPPLDTDLTIIEKILLKRVSFAYGEVKLLNNLTFEINKGDSIFLQGPSGSGKSTLIDLIAGLIGVKEGGIFINDIEYSKAGFSIAHNIAFVSQRVYIANASIYDNLTLGVPARAEGDLIPEKITEALYVSDLVEYIDSIEQGLDFTLGEDGGNISGGQRQRIGIARALIAERPIVIFDEATSALDFPTATRVAERLFSKQEGRTYIFISHDDLVKSRCNKIITITSNGNCSVEDKGKE